MTHPKVKEFRRRLEELCFELGVEFHHEDSQGSGYLMLPEDGGGTLEIGIYDDLREPYVPPPPTAEEIARAAELESLAAASRETWLAGRPETGPLMPPEGVTFPPLDPSSEEGLYARVQSAERDLTDAKETIASGLTEFHQGETLKVLCDSNFEAGKRIGELEIEQLFDRQKIARLESELHAVRVLDAWAKKHSGLWVSKPKKCWYSSDDAAGHGDGATAAEARSAAAKALLEEDPSLGEAL
jgi:hypothetical protein